MNKTISDETEATAFQMFKKMEQVIMGGITELQDNGDFSPVHHLYASLVAAAAAIQMAARIISLPSKRDPATFDEWSEKPLDRQTIVAAALILSRCLIPNEKGFTFQYNASNVKAAVEAAKTVTGNPDTSMFTPEMISQVYKSITPSSFLDNSGMDASFNDSTRSIH